jgi:hypothetical protein
MWPMPKVMRPPIVPKKPRKEIQIAEREACSWRVHQMPVIATKPGEMVASNMPRKKRTVASPAKEEHVAVSMRIEAHAMMLTLAVSYGMMRREGDVLPRNFAMGKRCSSATPGYSARR